MARIGMAAWALGISEHTLRRWETEKKISPPSRSPTGQRDYSDNDIKEIMRYLATKNNGHNND